MKDVKPYGNRKKEQADKMKAVEKRVKGMVIKAVFVIIVLIALGTVVYSVPKGENGCIFSKANGWDYVEKTQGWHLKIPVVETVDKMQFRTQTLGVHSSGEGEKAVLVPKDVKGINFKVDVTLRYKMDENQICEFIEQKGKSPEALLITALRSDSTRGVFGKYPQEEVPAKRIEIAAEIQEVLQNRINKEASGQLKENFIIIESVDIRNVQFDSRIEEAIVSKQTEKQEAEKQEYVLQKTEMEKEIAIVRAEANKQATILEAQGKAEAILVEASAKAEGISKVNDAYQRMPVAYVEVKYAEAMKELASADNTIVMDLGRFQSGNNLGIFDYNKLMGYRTTSSVE